MRRPGAVVAREFRWLAVGLLFIAPTVAGCRLRSAAAAPSLEFTLVPPADAGGTDRLGTIAGRVGGALPGQQIVLYARSGAWYVQPFADRPFTTIEADSTWKSSTHLGTEYAALLVDPDYRPPATMDALPSPGAGVSAVATVEGEPVFWRTRWFQLSCLLAAVLVMWLLHRLRLHQLAGQLGIRFEERLAERTRIAQHLYDTLLQGFLGASMQLHLAVDQLPEDSPQRPDLDRAMRMIGQATDEGRRVLQGLRSSDGGDDGLEESLSRIRHELEVADAVEFRMMVEGAMRRVHPIIRDEVYRVAREALVNAFRHSRARAVEVAIQYSSKVLRVRVRDDGCGIDPRLLDGDGTGCRGLAGMRQTAERIGARLQVRSRPGAGTEVELTVPSGIAFRAQLPRAQSSESERPV